MRKILIISFSILFVVSSFFVIKHFVSKSVSDQAPQQTQSEPNDSERPYKSLELKVIGLMNEERAEENLPPLQVYYAHYNKVVIRANECLELWSHYRPIGGEWHTVYDGASDERIKLMGENLARSFTTAEKIVKALMESPAHRANIMHTEYTHVCVGIILQETNDKYTTYAMAQHFYKLGD